MGRWLKSTVFKFVLVLIIIVSLAAAITWWPAHKARQLIIEQKALSSQAVSQLKQAHQFLNDLPALDANNIRKQGAIKFYADQAKRISDQFNQISLVRPPNLQPLFGVSANGEYQIIKDVNFTLSRIHQKAIYTNSRNDTEEADKLMAYHAAVSEALVNVLEYDPVADTQGFDLKSPDTQERLYKARDGLIKTDEQLLAAKKIYQEPSIDEVTALISGMRFARFQLSQNGDAAAWIKTVEDAQSKIVQNRISFWAKAPGPVSSRLARDQSQMTTINRLWQQDATKYRLAS